MLEIDLLDYDVIIVGAGISGINAAYRIQTQVPGTSYAIFEARDSLGGTWDYFKYPGIRCDSDMFTFGFEWNPWPRKETLAAGKHIKDYLVQSATSTGIDKHIFYQHGVKAANWNFQDLCWEISAVVNGKETLFRSRFIFLGTGYYDYETPLQTVIPGIENFKGKVIHPQFWPEGYDYTGKNVVVIGSGATAITVVPSMAADSAHVTMLQRSPTYIFPRPKVGSSTSVIFAIMPSSVARMSSRSLWILRGYLMMFFCRRWPHLAKGFIRKKVERLLPTYISYDTHFQPSYNPWEQRVCASMDGDFFAAMRSGKVSVVTDHIETVTDKEIKLKSGDVLEPDVIITATGLKVKFAGGIAFSIDGEPFNASDKFTWRACMLQDLPNVFFSIGYENASWTLGADCAAQLTTRLLKELKKRDAKVAVPYVENADDMEPAPLFSLSSTYLKNVQSFLPKTGTGVWSSRSHYCADLYSAKWGDVSTGMLLR